MQYYSPLLAGCRTFASSDGSDNCVYVKRFLLKQKRSELKVDFWKLEHTFRPPYIFFNH